MPASTYIRRPRAVTSSLAAAAVAKAYNYPTGVTGDGVTVGIVELGGGFPAPSFPGVTAVSVDGGQNTQDGPNGADAEVQLDIEIVQQVAPGAKIRVYFAPNTDAGFADAIKRAHGECDVVSVSWGAPENEWSSSAIAAMHAAITAAPALVNIFAAAGDSGSNDGTSAPVTDYPASDPNVIGCGGTRLTLNADGTRAAEVTWDDNDTTSATGGGLSKVFPGRQVPDVAGNADPQTGYQVTVDGGSYVIGGTSAVAPLYAGLTALLIEATGARFDFLKTVMANPQVCYDVTVGDNGAYRAGPGRDQVTGFGVVDGGKLLAVLKGATPPPPPSGTARVWDDPADVAYLDKWAASAVFYKRARQAWQRGHS